MIYTPFTQVPLDDSARPIAEGAWLNALQTTSARGEFVELDAVLNRFSKPKRNSIAVGDGWHWLLAELDRELSAIYPDYEITCIKEKFAGLRVYTNVSYTKVSDTLGEAEKEKFFELIINYETASYSVSEIPGSKGCLHRNKAGWLKTINPAEAGETFEKLGQMP